MNSTNIRNINSKLEQADKSITEAYNLIHKEFKVYEETYQCFKAFNILKALDDTKKEINYSRNALDELLDD